MERLGVTWQGAPRPPLAGALAFGEEETASSTTDQASEDFSITTTQLRYQRPLLSSGNSGLSRDDVKLALKAGYESALRALGLD